MNAAQLMRQNTGQVECDVQLHRATGHPGEQGVGAVVSEVWLAAPAQPLEPARWTAWLHMESWTIGVTLVTALGIAALPRWTMKP